jgi:UDP-N-acetylglucosamine diphosphorylase / glucose-1-phosphate thymidylyltransferase / UDP-N-acetylgalactosamine diphosphorylase / glucosamine-1-phosphate N-acetyltransferase / galactosamine-1-phosphate N-acetyltransferase
VSNLILFEDQAASRFLPLAWTRPVFDLRCGIWTLREAIEHAYGCGVNGLFVRDYLAPVTKERTGVAVNAVPAGDYSLLINGRLLAAAGLSSTLPMNGEPRRFVNGEGMLLGAWTRADLLEAGLDSLDALPAETVEWTLLEWPWELVEQNANRITDQALAWPLGQQPELVGVHLLYPDRIFVHPTSIVQPGVVLDATAGPVVIDAGVTVMANAVIQGPGYVGPGSQVKIGAKIYHGTTIGPTCKVGGEVEESVFLGYSNKQHDGFLGHAYIGEWCNFGADSNNSDLKNTYSPVSLWSDGAFHDTGSLFVGLFMGDHSKTAINSVFNTGTVVGVSCNLFGGGVPPKYVPSFSWGGSEATWHEYDLARALDTAARVMARRQVDFSDAERALLEHVFHATAGEREALKAIHA